MKILICGQCGADDQDRDNTGIWNSDLGVCHDCGPTCYITEAQPITIDTTTRLVEKFAMALTV